MMEPASCNLYILFIKDVTVEEIDNNLLHFCTEA